MPTTVTPGTMAPEGSVMTPCMDPLPPIWASMGMVNRTQLANVRMCSNSLGAQLAPGTSLNFCLRSIICELWEHLNGESKGEYGFRNAKLGFEKATEFGGVRT